MSSRVGPVLGACAALGLVLSGCTVNGPDPVPAGEESSQPSTEPNTPKLPARTVDYDLSKVTDPCTLLTPEQQGQLGVQRSRASEVRPPFNAVSCQFAVTEPTVYGIDVTPIPNQGIDAILKQSAGLKEPSTAQVYTVGGVPAYQSQPKGASTLGCGLFLDVADGQSMEVGVTSVDRGALNNQQMCEKAKQGAEAVVATLQQQR